MIAAIVATIVLLVALVLRVEVDTGPENMLSASNRVRVLNRSIAEECGAKNMLVLGIVNESGVLNGVTLENAPVWSTRSKSWTASNRMMCSASRLCRCSGG